MPRLRPLPWIVLLELATIAREAWTDLPEQDRRDLSRIVVKSKGRYGNLTPQERQELRRLVGRIDLPSVGKRLLPLAAKRRRRPF